MKYFVVIFAFGVVIGAVTAELTRQEYTVIDIIPDGHLGVMDENGAYRKDINFPGDNLGHEILVAFEKNAQIIVTVMNDNGQESVVDVKIGIKWFWQKYR